MIEIIRQSSAGLASRVPIKVVGLGGAGLNALDRIQLDGLDGAELVAINTDAQSLAGCVAPVKVQIGRDTTRGLGTGMDPDLGKQAAEETREEIQEVLKGSDMVFVTCGMGGGTGTGAAPAVAAPCWP